jgi:4-hydroxy-2-oxoheptanedioate aldolase
MKHHPSILRERLNLKQAIHCFKSNLPTIVAPQLLGGLGVDCLWFDQEHLPTDTLTMYSLIVAAHAVDTDAVVRVPNGSLSDAVRMLDAGADAIMYPRVKNAAEVAELIKVVRFAPIGDRGIDTMVFSNQFGSRSVDGFALHANEQNVIIVQIETGDALEDVETIAAVSGIDVLFIGTGDLARELGVKCDPQEPRLVAAQARIANAARANGLAWGTPAFSIEHAADLLAAGAQFIAHGSDTSMLRTHVTKLCQQIDSLGIPRGRPASA